MADGVEFTGEIRVASRIVDYLSSGLYKDPAACLKELVNNAFDADAARVAIFVKPDADRIIIEDDGMGMTRKEFQAHFDHVSESRKRDQSDLTPTGRPKIGLIGIGFIAANEICDVMEVFSTTEGSTELLHVTIDFAEMRKPAGERRRTDSEIAKADYRGEVLKAAKSDHYTQLFLKQVRGDARRILAGAGGGMYGDRGRSLYGSSVDELRSALATMRQRKWTDEFDDYSSTMLQVALNVPVAYLPQWMPRSGHRAVKTVEERLSGFGFDVSYDGAPLRKPILFTSDDFLCRPLRFDGEHVGFDGYLYAQRYNLKPQDLNGVLIRIRNSAVGEYRPDFLGFPSSRYTLFQKWVSSELYVDDRLEAALNIDRRTLRDTHPAYIEMQSAFHELLDGFLETARQELYDKPAEQRRNLRAATNVKAVRSTIEDLQPALSAAQIGRIIQVLDKRVNEVRFRRALSKNYSASQLFDLAVEAAEAVLEPREVERFVSELMRRLG